MIQASGNKGQCSEVKGTGTISPGKSQGGLNHPTLKPTLASQSSIQGFHPRGQRKSSEPGVAMLCRHSERSAQSFA